MEHIQFLILVLPAMTCLNWIIFHSVYAFRTDTFRIIWLLLTVTFLLLLVDSIYDAPGVSLHTVAWTNLVAQFTAPCIIPLAWLYLEKLRKGPEYHSPLHTLWIFQPVALFTGGVLLYSLSSVSEIESLLQHTYDYGWISIGDFRGSNAYYYYIWTFIAFRAVLIGEALYLLAYIIIVYRREKMSPRHLFRFLFRGGRISVLELQMVNIFANLLICPLKLLPIKSFIDAHPYVIIMEDVGLMVLIALFGMTALLGAKKEVSLKDLVNCLRFNYGEKTKEAVLRDRIDSVLFESSESTLNYIQQRLVTIKASEKAQEAPETPPTISERLFSEITSNWEHGSLQSEFDRLMTEERLFLQPKLRLEDIAEKLHTNKTYVSRMVNNTYGMGFSELINMMRIDYAEQYIIAHRTAKQAEIAEACGFISASAFNNIFKKITGLTPKSWLSQWGSANETH